MPESTGKTGRGITFELEDNESPTGWLAIANATSINITGMNAEEVDFTHLGSSGGFREFRQGFKDPGTVAVEYHFTPTEPSHVQLLEDWLDGTVKNWRINYTGAGWNYYRTGRGFVQNPGDSNVTVNDPVTGSSTIRVTGETHIVAAP